MTEIVSKPDHGVSLIDKDGEANIYFQLYLDEIEQALNLNLLGDQVQHPPYTVATLPSAIEAGGSIFVSDEVGGSILAFSDGINWRRVTDRAIVSA